MSYSVGGKIFFLGQSFDIFILLSFVLLAFVGTDRPIFLCIYI